MSTDGHRHLADRPPGRVQGEARQSLSTGLAGTALLHITRARAGDGSWRTAHAWVRAVADGDIDAGPHAALYYGAPALSYLLHQAGSHYAEVLPELDQQVVRLTHRRVDAALARISRHHAATFAEYDVFTGLTGIGRLLLEYLPGTDALGRVLRYLTRLTRTNPIDGVQRPGWWVAHNPDPNLPTSGGHANLGLAHGITGPLALLALALARGVVVDGHTDAITTIQDHLDAWRQDSPIGPWWPQWLNHNDLSNHRTQQTGPGRPSWCYGAPGIARAQQLAALATGDLNRQARAEHALAAAITTPAHLNRITNDGLCHGWAGLHQTVWRAAQDATTEDLRAAVPTITNRFLNQTELEPEHHNHGFLTGTAGVALARHSLNTTPATTGWDSCLLIA